MRKLLAGTLAIGGIGMSASGAPLVYEPFDYTAGQTLSTADGAGGWININGTAEPMTASGNLSHPNLPPPDGNSVTFDGTGAASSSQLPIPGGPQGAEGTTVYYSMIFKVNSLDGMSNSGGNFPTGSFLAGFRDSNSTANAATTNLGGVLLIRSAHSSGSHYQLGVGLTAANAERDFYGTNSDEVIDPASDFDTADMLLIVVSYENIDNAPDIARLWINPNPALGEAGNTPQLTNAAASSASETAGNDIESFFLRNNSVEPDIMQADELRIGTSWNDVLAVPEPTGLALLSLGGLALAKRRRRGVVSRG